MPSRRSERGNRRARGGRGAVDVWSIPLTTPPLAPIKPATHHPHPDHDVEGLSAMTGDKRHALTDELKLLLPVVHTCPPTGEVTGITESPYHTNRLRVSWVQLSSERRISKDGDWDGCSPGTNAYWVWLSKARVELACQNFFSTLFPLAPGICTSFAYRSGHPPKTTLASCSRAREAASHLDSFGCNWTARCTALDLSQTFSESTTTKTAARFGTMRLSRWSWTTQAT